MEFGWLADGRVSEHRQPECHYLNRQERVQTFIHIQPFPLRVTSFSVSYMFGVKTICMQSALCVYVCV